MAFHGLFIGIDRYATPRISWLTAAVRDARALHAVFADTIGGDCQLLIDGQATRSAIESAFADLQLCDPDDTVVIAFSGHGSPTHEIVPYDTDLADVRATGIDLETLSLWFSRIPASRLVCILDCCFSGGMGAKVLVLDALPRSLDSVDYDLDRLAGSGRLIITASAANEEAWEDSRIGHGFLTRYLLDALQGVDQVGDGDRLSGYRLLDYVVKRVVSAANAIGHPQHPTLRGQIDGIFEWPIFRKGEAYEAAFPGSVHPPATADISSLLAFGLPQQLLDAWAAQIPALNDLQLAAINECGVLDGEHVVVTAPTSSGKTMVGELGALKAILERKRAVFLLPLKALVNDKYAEFQRTYGDFGLRVTRATGDTADDIPALMRGHYDICLLTYEMYAQLVLANPHLLRQVGTIVIDEVQTIVDSSRGSNLEFLLTLIRARRVKGIEPQIIALSAVIGDTNGLDLWLGAKLLRYEERPVPLHEGVMCRDGSFRYLTMDGREHVDPRITPEPFSGENKPWIIPLVRQLTTERKQVIVFRDTKSETKFVARYLAENLGLPAAQGALDRLPSGDPSRASEFLRAVLSGGVGFHNSELDRDERLVLEEEFRSADSSLRVLVATTTLAMGINTPAGAVVLVGLEHPGEPPQRYSIAEYKNIVGRAGRLGYTDHGESYIVTPTGLEEHQAWDYYVLGQPEDIVSRFLSTDLRSLIIRVVSLAEHAGGGLAGPEIVAFLDGSFGAFQKRQWDVTWAWNAAEINRALQELETHKLVTVDSAGRYVPTPLGRLAGERGTHVESIIRLSAAISHLDPTSIGEATIVAAAQMTVELDEQYFPLNKRSSKKEPATWIEELKQQRVPLQLLNTFHSYASSQHVPTLRAKRTCACLYWMTAWPLQGIEQALTRHGGFDVVGPTRSVASRTRDVLPTVVRVAEILHPGLDLAEIQSSVVIRLELGLPLDAVDLGRHAAGRLSRRDYLALTNAGLISIDELNVADDSTVLRVLNNDREKLKAVRAAVKAAVEAASSGLEPLLPTPRE